MPARTVAKLDSVDAAYLAGLIDGEGSISLTRLHAGANRQLLLSISSTEQEWVDWAMNRIGAGKITRKRPGAPGHAPGLTYSIANRQALAVLRQVTPYLRSYKRQRAELVLDKYLAVTPRNGRYTDELRSARTAFEGEFAAMAVRGMRGNVTAV
jgi:hypothetical protein